MTLVACALVADAVAHIGEVAYYAALMLFRGSFLNSFFGFLIICACNALFFSD